MFKKIKNLFSQNITVILVPHSTSQTMQFKINLSLIVFFSFLILTMTIGFFALSSFYIGSESIMNENESQFAQSQARLDMVSDEIHKVVINNREFNDQLSDAIQMFDIESENNFSISNIGRTDLESFFNISSAESFNVHELQNVNQSLENATRFLAEIQSVMNLQSELFFEIPNHWPVLNNIGYVSMEFGPNIHPITGQWYLHKGFDVAAPLGTPVVSSADGKVLDIGYDPDYGFYVIIRHKYGFRTQYSHLQDISVIKGQDINQGEEIGFVGNTGISTGPHLDFIIMLGSDVVDPSAFLTARNSFVRGTEYAR